MAYGDAVESAKLYGPVSSKTQKVTGLYGSVGGARTGIYKLYGSANGQREQVYRGHAAAPYGTVFCKNSATGPVIQYHLRDSTEFNKLCTSSTSSVVLNLLDGNSVSVNKTQYPKIVGVDIGPNITSMGTYFLAYAQLEMPVIVPETVTHIGSHFLYGSETFNLPVTIDANVTTVGSYFMSGCGVFNSDVKLPDTLTSVPSHFMSYCGNFNRPISFPKNVTVINEYAFHNCVNYCSTITFNATSRIVAVTSPDYILSATTSSAKIYTEGVRITGSGAAFVKEALPDRTASPYRKLIVV